MKLLLHSRSQTTRGYVLLMVTILLAISIVMVTGLLNYSSGNAKQNARNNDYYTALGAAEAATEKALSQVTSDFRDYGVGYVQLRLDTYRQMVPLATEAPDWANFDFMDLSGYLSRNEVQYNASTGSYVPLGTQYGPLKAFKDEVRILSNARAKNSPNPVTASVYQDIELSRIPIFQYAIFYNITLEFTPLPPMVISGPVHCNTNIYVNPAGTLTFNNDLTASGTIYQTANPASPMMPALGGTVVYKAAHDSGTSTLSLPIGTNNSPAAVRQVLDLPPVLENPQSSIGQQRYYNKADLVIMVSNSAVVVRSGLWNNFATSLSSNEVATFVSTNTSFFNKREGKNIQVIQIDVAKLVQWNATNASIRPYLPLTDVRTIYVNDQRTLLLTESGVRLVNGTNLPPQGLTVATPSPVYIQGDYNCPAAARGTTNTSGTLPASIASDAITILSGAWRDTNSNTLLSSGSRNATDTTINAAFLTGIVASSLTSDSGGVENFPRYLEDWTGHTNTYNGSMVAMYYSQVATGNWVGIGAPPNGNDSYNPPNRNWGLDQNFQYGNKLPPNTPSLMVLGRANWRTPAAYTTNIMAGF